jgi:RNA polymerase sigma factor (sigma-70 family)
MPDKHIQHWKALLKQAIQLAGPELGPEVAAEAWRALQRSPGWEERARSREAYVTSVIRNTIRTLKRRESLAQSRQKRVDPRAKADRAPDMAGRLQAAFTRVVDQLSDQQWALLRVRVIDGKTRATTAKHLAISPDRVRRMEREVFTLLRDSVLRDALNDPLLASWLAENGYGDTDIPMT